MPGSIREPTSPYLESEEEYSSPDEGAKETPEEEAYTPTKRRRRGEPIADIIAVRKKPRATLANGGNCDQESVSAKELLLKKFDDVDVSLPFQEPINPYPDKVVCMTCCELLPDDQQEHVCSPDGHSLKVCKTKNTQAHDAEVRYHILKHELLLADVHLAQHCLSAKQRDKIIHEAMQTAQDKINARYKMIAEVAQIKRMEAKASQKRKEEHDKRIMEDVREENKARLKSQHDSQKNQEKIAMIREQRLLKQAETEQKVALMRQKQEGERLAAQQKAHQKEELDEAQRRHEKEILELKKSLQDGKMASATLKKKLAEEERTSDRRRYEANRFSPSSAVREALTGTNAVNNPALLSRVVSAARTASSQNGPGFVGNSTDTQTILSQLRETIELLSSSQTQQM